MVEPDLPCSSRSSDRYSQMAMGGITLNKRTIYLRVSVIPLIVFALFGLLFRGTVPPETGTVAVTIVHTNDVHGHVWAEEGGAMGYAHLAAVINGIRETKENVLLLDAGDTFQGSSAASLSRGESIVQIMNSMGYDAMAAGNHDFAYGWQRLGELAEMAAFPVLSANVQKPDGSQLLKSFTIKEVDGIRIGIIGLTTLETRYKTHPHNVEGLIFADPVERAREVVEELRDECDLLIALAHLPLMDGEDSCVRLAEEVEELDLIVSGHSHVPLENSLVINDTLIVQAGEYGEKLGIVDIVLRDGVPEVVNASLYTPAWTGASLPVDEAVQTVITETNKEYEKLLSQVIGWTDVFLDGERDHVRTRATNLGTLVAEAMRAATGADGAIMNGGGIRASIKAGEITRRDVLDVLPLDNFVLVKELKGSVLLQALENGVAEYPEISGAFPQVAGIEFRFDPARKPGNRIIEVKVAGEELDPDRLYRIAINDFMAAGGIGYTMLEEGRVLGEPGILEDIVVEFIQQNLK